MGQITRQMKRKLKRDFGNQHWQVQDWKPMKFFCEADDPVDNSRVIRVYTNDVYQCIVRELGEYTHLSIKRIDKAIIHEWKHLQQIKNDICGNEREAVELYPAMSRIVDTCNQYHLWVLKSGFRFSLGYSHRLVGNQ